MEKIKAMKKQIIIAMVIVVCLLAYTPTVHSATTVTGTFTPTGGSVSIAVNQTAPAFGNIALGASAENLSINITNDGTVNCSVVTTAGDGPGTWELVAGTSSPATSDQFCINMDPEDASYVDIYTEQTVIADMRPLTAGLWHVKVDLKVFVSEFTTEGTPGQQTFYANMTAAALS